MKYKINNIYNEDCLELKPLGVDGWNRCVYKTKEGNILKDSVLINTFNRA